MTADENFLRTALSEARKGLGKTHPNPAVGAILVKGSRILARGWHRAAGQPHAEVEALRQLGDRSADGLTLYVTLEPCSTRGRTPPCTNTIIEAGISRVVYGATDPNPRHAGRAAALLRAAGIQVRSGLLAVECEALNAEWNRWMRSGLPHVIAKAGMTLDGQIASPPDRRWITSPASRRDAMALRASVQAILIGAETLRIDNPRLTVRGQRLSQQPLRAIWTRSHDLPKSAHLFCDAHRDRTIVLSGLSLRAALRKLSGQGVARVLIEGGGRILGEAFDRGLVDEVAFYMAPLLSGGPVAAVGGRGVSMPSLAPKLRDVRFTRIGSDVKLSGEVLRPEFPKSDLRN